MREMKESGVGWIGEIPENWYIGRVKNIFKNKKEVVGDKADDYERLSLTLNGVLKRSKETNDGLQPEEFKGYQILHENELVFKLIDLENIKTSRVGLSPYTGIVSPAYITLNNPLHTRFGYYFFLSLWHRNIFNALTGDGVRGNLSAKDLLNLEYPFVPFNEQEAIVSYLEQKVALIDNIIEKTKESIEEYKKLKQSIITEAVTKGLNPDVKMKDSGIEWIGEIPEHWEVGKLGRFGDAIIGLTYSPSDVSDKGLLVLRSSNVKAGEIDLTDKVFVDLDVKDKLILKYNDILICSRNGSRALIGKCALIEGEAIGKTFGAFMTVYRSEYNPFIYYVLNSNIFNFHLSTFLTSTINQLTTSNLNSIQIALPPITEQNLIVDSLKRKCCNIDKLVYQKKLLLDELESYKKSLIYEVVTGKKEIE